MIASEPLVSDPVAMEIDEYGRMYVVEMHGYPLDKGGSGKIKLLSDEDGDGKMDKSVTFAEGLTLPTGILRWKKGVLVTDPPNVVYFEDTDGDGIADIRDTILTGFPLFPIGGQRPYRGCYKLFAVSEINAGEVIALD